MPLIKLIPRVGDRVLILAVKKTLRTGLLRPGNNPFTIEPLSYGNIDSGSLFLAEGIVYGMDNEYGYPTESSGGQQFFDTLTVLTYPSWNANPTWMRATTHPNALPSSLDTLNNADGLSTEAKLFLSQFVVPQVIGTREYCNLVADITGNQSLPASVAVVAETVYDKATGFGVEYVPLTAAATAPRELYGNHEQRMEEVYSHYTDTWSAGLTPSSFLAGPSADPDDHEDPDF